jgi:DNA modification methylase
LTYGLRDYGIEGQIGLEETPEAFINRLVEVFRAVRRVLKPEGTLWLNIGDTYAGGGRGCDSPKQQTNKDTVGMPRSKVPEGCKRKDLIGIPWMLAFALRLDGWYLRQDIIWAKTNPMPESVTDRCTKSHEYIFLLSKSNKYYFDNAAIKEPVADATKKRVKYKENAPRYGGSKYTAHPDQFYRTKSGNAYEFRETRNKRDVWFISTQPTRDAHFATFPEELVRNCLLAGCPEGGIVLDPFMGSGTTALVAIKNNRHYIGCELNPEYIKIANGRIGKKVKPAISLSKWLDELLEVAE